MITWLVGDNSFEVREALDAIVASFDGMPERIDGTTLTLAELPDLLMGISLFSLERLVIITDLSQNTALWEKLPEWLPRISDTIHVIFIDEQPDKRRASYKALKEAADLREFPAWTERDGAKAERWVADRAKTDGLVIDSRCVRALVERVGPNQWQLSHALERLSLVDHITVEVIEEIIPANPTESVFQLFEAALEGRPAVVAERFRTLLLHEDPYAVFALLGSQVVSLAAIAHAEASDSPAKDFGIHPFVISKLGSFTKKLGKAKVVAIVKECAQTDADLKRSKAEPDLLVERFLVKVASLVAA